MKIVLLFYVFHALEQTDVGLLFNSTETFIVRRVSFLSVFYSQVEVYPVFILKTLKEEYLSAKNALFLNIFSLCETNKLDVGEL